MVKSVTASEALANLEADPAYKKMQAEREELRLIQSSKLRAEEKPLLDDLRSCGWVGGSIWDLVNTSDPYPELVSVLVFHLRKSYSERIREGIARALAIPDAAHAWQALRTEYEKSSTPDAVRDGLAAALSAAATDVVIDEMIELARNPANGNSRLLLLIGLRRSKSQVAIEAINSLSSDPFFAKEIRSWKRYKR